MKYNQQLPILVQTFILFYKFWYLGHTEKITDIKLSKLT